MNDLILCKAQSILLNIFHFLQVIGLKDHEMTWLCRHLGHTRKVHEQYYRTTSGLIERLDVAKLMLLQEGNMHGKFQGKSLKDITFEGTVL